MSEDDWITGQAACKMLVKHRHQWSSFPDHHIRTGLKNGLITAKCKVANFTKRDRFGDKSKRIKNFSAPEDIWNGSPENSSFVLRDGTYTSRAPGTGYSSVELIGISLNRNQFCEFTEISTDEVRKTRASSAGPKQSSNAGNKASAIRWEKTSAAIVALRELDQLDFEDSLNNQAEAIAAFLNERGHEDAYGVDTIRSMLRRAKAWSSENSFHDDSDYDPGAAD